MTEEIRELENDVVETELENDVYDDETESTEESVEGGGLETILIIGAVGALVGAVTTKVVVPRVKCVAKAGLTKIGGAIANLRKKEEETVEGEATEEPVNNEPEEEKE